MSCRWKSKEGQGINGESEGWIRVLDEKLISTTGSTRNAAVVLYTEVIVPSTHIVSDANGEDRELWKQDLSGCCATVHSLFVDAT